MLKLELLMMMCTLPDNKALLIVADGEVNEVHLQGRKEGDKGLDFTREDILDFLNLPIDESTDYAIVEKGTFYRLSASGRIVTKNKTVVYKWMQVGA